MRSKTFFAVQARTVVLMAGLAMLVAVPASAQYLGQNKVNTRNSIFVF